jgi:hypothetical protein
MRPKIGLKPSNKSSTLFSFGKTAFASEEGGDSVEMSEIVAEVGKRNNA